MTTTIKGILCWGLAVLLAAPAWGQEIGDRVRIKVKGRKSYLVGNLTAIDGEKFIIQRYGHMNTVPRTLVTQMSRRVSTKRNVKSGAIIGGSIGLASGFFFEILLRDLFCLPDDDCFGEPFGMFALRVAVVGVLPGAFGGWIIKTDKWEVIKLGEEAQVGIAPVFRLATREGSVRPTIGLSMQFQKK